MSELLATVREAVAALAAADPARRRFGAARHGYALAAPLDDAALAGVEAALGAALPDDLRGFAAEVGAGGAGPGYGVVPIDRAAAYAVTVAAPGADAPWRRALPVVDLGCGHAAVVALDGPARGEVWACARAVELVRPLAPSFTAYYLDWIDRLAHARWPEPAVPPGRCALAAALSGYLGHCEAQLGVPAGSLAGPALRDALAQLGPGAIAVAADSAIAWFDETDRVDPCLACARLLDNLAGDGLRADVVAPGVVPRPLR